MTYGVLSPARILVIAAMVSLAGCATATEKETLATAVPTDTYDTCRAGGGGNLSGVSNLFSAASPGVVKLGMSECALVQVLGEPSQVLRGGIGLVEDPIMAAPGSPSALGAPSTPGAAPVAIPAGQRRITLVYAVEQGRATGYRFVNNALKEISRM
ncbi:MAG: hypothetical protein ACTSY1_07990 [Alphaproteobacteria bacterium]